MKSLLFLIKDIVKGFFPLAWIIFLAILFLFCPNFIASILVIDNIFHWHAFGFWTLLGQVIVQIACFGAFFFVLDFAVELEDTYLIISGHLVFLLEKLVEQIFSPLLGTACVSWELENSCYEDDYEWIVIPVFLTILILVLPFLMVLILVDLILFSFFGRYIRQLSII